MSDAKRKLDRLQALENAKKYGLIAVVGFGMAAMGAFLSIVYEPMKHLAFKSGMVRDYRVAQRSGIWGGSVPYWVVDTGAKIPALIKQPSGRQFERGQMICVEEVEGMWTARRKNRIADTSECEN